MNETKDQNSEHENSSLAGGDRRSNTPNGKASVEFL